MAVSLLCQVEMMSSTAMLVPRVREAMSRFLACDVRQLVLCPVDAFRLLAAPCTNAESVLAMSGMVRGLEVREEELLTRTPVMMTDAHTCMAYPQLGEQCALQSLQPDARVCLNPWPMDEQQIIGLLERFNTIKVRTTGQALDHDVGTAQLVSECWFCARPARDGQKLAVCGKCHYARYCGPDCQSRDWSLHKAGFCGQYRQQKRKSSR